MILRDEGEEGVLAIGQASHAWISGQLARAWGNRRFGTLHPFEEVCLAAEQHDVGMAMWDLTASFDPATGLPYSFSQMPLGLHIGLWGAAPEKLLTQSRYAALLVSMHGMRLYELRDLDELDREAADRVRAYLHDQRALQQRLIDSLAADRSAVARNSDLIWTWDFVSLALCLDWPPCEVASVPSADGPVTIRLSPTGEHRTVIDPWPFTAETVTVRAEGRRLSGGYESEAAMREALAGASWEAIAFELRRA